MCSDITVIIPTKNEERSIGKCLLAVLAQTMPAEEILVVDGQSTDSTADLSRAFGAHVIFESYGTRAGACQAGIESATGEFVAFTDADCIPDPHWLEELLPHLSDEVVGVGGKVLNEGESYWQESVNAALDSVLGSANSVQGRNFPRTRVVSSISGCNSVYRRKDLIEAGGFRTDLVTAEDAELNRRLQRRGKLLYVPDAIVHHRHARGLRAFAKRVFEYGYGRGQALLLGPPLVVPVSVPFLIAMAVLFPLWAALLALSYLALLLASSAWTSSRKRLRLFPALPLVYMIEHASYTAGFWVSILARLVSSRRRTSGRVRNVS